MFKGLEKFLSWTETNEKEQPPLEMATAVLFLEMVSADFEILPEEKKQMKDLLSDSFNLNSEDTEQLINEAKIQRQKRNDLWYFTNLIKKHFSREHRKEILEKLWLLIYADGLVDKYEDLLIRKVTTLLGLEHHDMIAAKFSAKEKVK